jgi:hypothetical protein
MYLVYGTRFLDSLDALAADYPTESKTYPNSPHHGGKAWDRRDEFEVNDEGWVVWVGKDNHYTDGIAKGLWGTTTNIGGIVYEWGIPNWWLTEAGAPRREAFGSNNQLNFGWGNNFRVGGQTTAHMQWTASVGQVIVDHTWTRTSDFSNPKHDQGGKPDELKKPTRAHYGNDGPGGHYHKSTADFMKMQSVGLSYQLNSDQIRRFGLGAIGLQSVTMGITGRDLIMFHNCSCSNVESTRRYEDGAAAEGNARNWNVGREYPASSTLTGEVSLTF